MAGRLTPQQQAYLMGYRRAMTRMRRELYDMQRRLDDEIADLREAVNRTERHYTQVKEVALAMAERDPDALLH